MAKSRYSQNPTLFDSSLNEPRHYATWDIPKSLKGYKPADLLSGQPVVEYMWEFGDRLDRLSSEHLGDDMLWWIIAFVNEISYPLGIPVGTVIKIPTSSRPILEKLGLV